MKPSKIAFIIALVITMNSSNAQTDSTKKHKPQFKLSINYSSSLNYYGRTDNQKSTGIFPLAELWFSKDLYLNAAPVFVNNSSSSFKYAGSVATFGYLHESDKLITNLYLTKTFYKQSTQLVQSALEAQTGFSFSFLNKYVNITTGGDLKLSDEFDLGTMAGLDHIIRKEIGEKTVFVVDPTLNAFAGTQNFTNTWYKKKSGFLLFPGSDEEVKENVKRFDVLAYEFSIPLYLVRGKWMTILTPSYVLPQNLVTIPNQPELSEQGHNMFYATLCLKHTF